ncbi:nuclear transport factor 2 family protein [Amycolatopsis sp.]|jgi:hypothetical protein|uniref:nuclear transport factor 2 family protein n=1 Tax=Amycolatopsis sp. TaxID=37632 RepID=UPI002E0A1DC1|nr:nuclear transport factor 2 family protein [Amycolatopsis sp.]
MDALDRLIAIEEIRRLKAAYFRLADKIDPFGRPYPAGSDEAIDLFVQLFTDEAVMDIRGAIPGATASDLFLATGRNAIRALLTTGNATPVRSCHHGYTHEIDILSPTAASGLWAMESRDQFDDSRPITKTHSFGHYAETYQYVAGSWKINSLTVTKYWSEATANPGGSWDEGNA